MKKYIISFLLLFTTLSNSISQILDPVKWIISHKDLGNNEFELIFKAEIDKGWHIYGTKPNIDIPIVPTMIAIDSSAHYSFIGQLRTEPLEKEKFDEVFGALLSSFHDSVYLFQKIKLHSSNNINIKGNIEFMACDIEQCLAPKQEEFSFSLGQASQESSVLSSPDKDNKQQEGLWSFFFLSVSAGFLAILMPCIYPMIPMTISFFIHNKETRKKGRLTALIFSASIILIYVTIGTLITILFGATFANFISTHWIPNILFFLIFLLFAFSFFGMFEIILPSWITNISTAQQDKSSSFVGTFFMAFTLTVVSFSCTGPIVGSILVASTQGVLLRPIIGMLGFSLPIAFVFGFFAFFPSWLKNLPKSGGWLNSIKVILGFIELAAALKFLSVADQTYHWHLLDREVYIAIWIVIAVLLGFYLLGKLKFAHDSDLKFISVPRLILGIATFSFAVYMLPGMFGAPLKALSGLLPPISTHDFNINKIVRNTRNILVEEQQCDKPKYSDRFQMPYDLPGYFDYEQGLACARELKKPIFIDFTGHGCVNCRKMEEKVWADPRVQERLRQNFIVIALYVDDKTTMPENDWITSNVDGKIKKTIGTKFADFQVDRFNINAQPYYVLLDLEENILINPKGMELNIANFIEFLDTAVERFNKKYK